MARELKEYQTSFIRFLISSGALTFGDFVLKSGRRAPYFINTGKFDTGERIAALGKFYAAHIESLALGGAASIFGPAYKGVPLCVATATALNAGFGRDVGFTFNRKEAKDHGDAGMFVGYAIKPGQKIIIVEDVVTAGTTLRQVVPEIRSMLKAEISGVVVAVDRREKGTGDRSAVRESEEELGIKIFPLVTVYDILTYLESERVPEAAPNLIERIKQYLEQYGAKD